MKIGLTSICVRGVNNASKFCTEVPGFVEKLRVLETDLAIVVAPEEPDGTALLLEPNGNSIRVSGSRVLCRGRS